MMQRRPSMRLAPRSAPVPTTTKETAGRMTAVPPAMTLRSKVGRYRSAGPRRHSMRKILELGGILAAVVLIAFGIGAIITGLNGRSTVQDNLKQEQIVGTPDMTPSGIKASAQKAGLPANVDLPTCSVAASRSTMATARAASPVHAHPRARGDRRQDLLAAAALRDGQRQGHRRRVAALKSKGQPVDNPIRNVWINETALSTALNTSYMAERISIFGIVAGIAMLLAGIGLAILALFVFGERAVSASEAS